MMGQNAMQMRQNPVRPMGNWQQNMTNMRMVKLLGKNSNDLLITESK